MYLCTQNNWIQPPKCGKTNPKWRDNTRTTTLQSSHHARIATTPELQRQIIFTRNKSRTPRIRRAAPVRANRELANKQIASSGYAKFKSVKQREAPLNSPQRETRALGVLRDYATDASNSRNLEDDAIIAQYGNTRQSPRDSPAHYKGTKWTISTEQFKIRRRRPKLCSVPDGTHFDFSESRYATAITQVVQYCTPNEQFNSTQKHSQEVMQRYSD